MDAELPGTTSMELLGFVLRERQYAGRVRDMFQQRATHSGRHQLTGHVGLRSLVLQRLLEASSFDLNRGEEVNITVSGKF
jgi:hypothetical protein